MAVRSFTRNLSQPVRAYATLRDLLIDVVLKTFSLVKLAAIEFCGLGGLEALEYHHGLPCVLTNAHDSGFQMSDL